MEKLRQPRALAQTIAELLCSSDYLINSPYPEGENIKIADWLYLAAGIEGIIFDRAHLLSDFGYCRGADNYELDRDQLLTSTLSELTRFLFCWGALESIIDQVDPPPHPSRKGKINAGCYLIQLHYKNNPPYGVDTAREALIVSLQEWNAPEELNQRFNRLSEFGNAAIVLHGIYGLRNELAHGSLNFPTLLDHTGIVETIKLCSLLTLITVQMLLAASLPGLHFNSSGISGVPYIDCDFQELLQHLHLVEHAWPENLP